MYRWSRMTRQRESERPSSGMAWLGQWKYRRHSRRGSCSLQVWPATAGLVQVSGGDEKARKLRFSMQVGSAPSGQDFIARQIALSCTISRSSYTAKVITLVSGSLRLLQRLEISPKVSQTLLRFRASSLRSALGSASSHLSVKKPAETAGPVLAWNTLVLATIVRHEEQNSYPPRQHRVIFLQDLFVVYRIGAFNAPTVAVAMSIV